MEKDKFYFQFKYEKTFHYMFAKNESVIFKWIYYILEA